MNTTESFDNTITYFGVFRMNNNYHYIMGHSTKEIIVAVIAEVAYLTQPLT